MRILATVKACMRGAESCSEVGFLKQLYICARVLGLDIYQMPSKSVPNSVYYSVFVTL